MKSIIKFLKLNAGKMFLLCLLLLALIIAGYWGMTPAIIYSWSVAIIFVVALVWRVFPSNKKMFFYNVHGRFEIYDIVYDRGSAIRPVEPGILKNDGEGWFIVYDDGFEWPMSGTRNIERFIYQPNK